MGENRILQALPTDVRERIESRIERVRVQARRSVYDADDAIREVYFPFDSVASMVVADRTGRTVEVATTGREGMVGLPVVWGTDTMQFPTIWQIGGEAGMLPADLLRIELRRGGALSDLLHRFAQAAMLQAAQAVACHKLHAVEQRTARWLLETHDRTDADHFDLTQDLMAMMVGVARPTVTIAVGGLQRAGMIRYERGRVTVLDRAALESAACECYQVVRSQFDRLIAPPASEPHRLAPNR